MSSSASSLACIFICAAATLSMALQCLQGTADCGSRGSKVIRGAFSLGGRVGIVLHSLSINASPRSSSVGYWTGGQRKLILATVPTMVSCGQMLRSLRHWCCFWGMPARWAGPPVELWRCHGTAAPWQCSCRRTCPPHHPRPPGRCSAGHRSVGQVRESPCITNFKPSQHSGRVSNKTHKRRSQAKQMSVLMLACKWHAPPYQKVSRKGR